MSQRSQDATEEKLAQIPVQESIVAQLVEQDGAIATVIQGNSTLQVRSAAPTLPPGSAVRLERRDGQLILIGPANPPSTVGLIFTIGTTCTVEYPPGSGVTAVLPRDAGYSPTVGDTVLLSWTDQGGFIVGKWSTSPTAKVPDLPPVAPAQTYDQVFTAIDSGSYQGGYGWRTNEVWSSASNIGAWFYGTKIHDSIPDSALILNAWIYLPLRQQVGAAPFGRHGYDYKPGGSLGFAGITDLGARSGWVAIPTSLIDHLKANVGGLGYDIGGYNIWAGTQQDGQSGAVRVIYNA